MFSLKAPHNTLYFQSRKSHFITMKMNGIFSDISSGRLQCKFPYDNIYCNKVHKTWITHMVKISLQTRWTLIVIIVPRHTKNRTGKHAVHIYSDGIDLQQAQKPQQTYQDKVRHLYTPANTARNRRQLTSTHMQVLHVTTYTHWHQATPTLPHTK